MAFLKIALLPKYEISPEKVLIERFSLRLTQHQVKFSLKMALNDTKYVPVILSNNILE